MALSFQVRSIDPVKIGVDEPRRVIGNVFGLDQLNILLKELQGWDRTTLLWISVVCWMGSFLKPRMIVPDTPNGMFLKPRAFVPDHPMMIG
jgi:hypothetical protein